MSDSEEQWSDNPNAPKIPQYLYTREKSSFAGILLASILYGFVIVLFFQCMTGLFDPVNRRRDGIKWGLVSYTVAVFSFATVITGTGLNLGSISFIDNREYPGSVERNIAPGPLGYQVTIYQTPASLFPSVAFLLGYWLADGLLLYRCYVIYAANLWVIVVPSLMYLGTLGMGLLIVIAQAHGWEGIWSVILRAISLPYVTVSVSLNILLTLMIVARLIIHGRNVRAATGSPAGISGLYKAVATMLIESSALYCMNSLVLIGMWAAKSDAAGAVLPVIAEVQVIAPLLIIKRVANRSALTSNTIVTGHIDSFHARTRGEMTGGSDIPSRVYPVGLTEKHEKISGELGAGIGIETTIDFHRDSMA